LSTNLRAIKGKHHRTERTGWMIFEDYETNRKKRIK
jgi:hypothetical protein